MIGASKSPVAVLVLICIVNIRQGQAAQPPAPSNLVADPEVTSIRLFWGQPPGERVDSFTIEFNFTVRGCSRSDNLFRLTLSGSSRSHTLTELEEDATYIIHITARNSEGESPRTTTTAITLSGAPSAPPTGIVISLVTSSSIAVNWTEISCLERNTDALGYNVSYVVRLAQSSVLARHLWQRNHINITRLFPRATYRITVAGYDFHSSLSGPSVTFNAMTDLSPDVGFYTNAPIPNNSIAAIESVTYFLHCVTNLRTCCTENEGTSAGEWHLPRRAQILGNHIPFRAPSAVGLQGNVWPSGIYTCKIPDKNFVLRTLYIGINTDSPVITDMRFTRDLLTLTCTSQGGPVDLVTWTRNGVEVGSEFAQTQTLIDTGTATYQHTLSSTSETYFVGSFTCTVRDLYGTTSSMTLTEDHFFSPSDTTVWIVVGGVVLSSSFLYSSLLLSCVPYVYAERKD